MKMTMAWGSLIKQHNSCSGRRGASLLVLLIDVSINWFIDRRIGLKAPPWHGCGR